MTTRTKPRAGRTWPVLQRAAACALLMLVAGEAHAQVLRTLATRYTSNQKGDVTLIANTMM